MARSRGSRYVTHTRTQPGTSGKSRARRPKERPIELHEYDSVTVKRTGVLGWIAGVPTGDTGLAAQYRVGFKTRTGPRFELFRRDELERAYPMPPPPVVPEQPAPGIDRWALADLWDELAGLYSEAEQLGVLPSELRQQYPNARGFLVRISGQRYHRPPPGGGDDTPSEREMAGWAGNVRTWMRILRENIDRARRVGPPSFPRTPAIHEFYSPEERGDLAKFSPRAADALDESERRARARAERPTAAQRQGGFAWAPPPAAPPQPRPVQGALFPEESRNPRQRGARVPESPPAPPPAEWQSAERSRLDVLLGRRPVQRLEQEPLPLGGLVTQTGFRFRPPQPAAPLREPATAPELEPRPGRVVVQSAPSSSSRAPKPEQWSPQDSDPQVGVHYNEGDRNWTAWTGARGKTFKTEAGARRWLAKSPSETAQSAARAPAIGGPSSRRAASRPSSRTERKRYGAKLKARVAEARRYTEKFAKMVGIFATIVREREGLPTVNQVSRMRRDLDTYHSQMYSLNLSGLRNTVPEGCDGTVVQGVISLLMRAANIADDLHFNRSWLSPANVNVPIGYDASEAAAKLREADKALATAWYWANGIADSGIVDTGEVLA